MGSVVVVVYNLILDSKSQVFSEDSTAMLVSITNPSVSTTDYHMIIFYKRDEEMKAYISHY